MNDTMNKEEEQEDTTDNGGDDTDNEEDAVVRKLRIMGDGEGFTTSAFRVGDKLRPKSDISPTTVKVIEILDNITCIVDATQVPEKEYRELLYSSKEGSCISHKYDILKHVDLHSMFEKVLDKLAMGGT